MSVRQSACCCCDNLTNNRTTRYRLWSGDFDRHRYRWPAVPRNAVPGCAGHRGWARFQGRQPPKTVRTTEMKLKKMKQNSFKTVLFQFCFSFNCSDSFKWSERAIPTSRALLAPSPLPVPLSRHPIPSLILTFPVFLSCNKPIFTSRASRGLGVLLGCGVEAQLQLNFMQFKRENNFVAP